jgi:hypothetical protein
MESVLDAAASVGTTPTFSMPSFTAPSSFYERGDAVLKHLRGREPEEVRDFVHVGQLHAALAG